MTDYTQEKITLAPYMRALLLKEICRRMDIISYCQNILNIPLKESIKGIFDGDCPFCNDLKTFGITKGTGKCFCNACKTKGDFLTLMCKMENYDLNSVLHMLTGYLRATETRKTKHAGGAS